MSETVRSFKLSLSFTEQYKNKQPDWGPVGYITYKRTYARPREDGTTEEFWETCQRVIEGVYSIQKQHCKSMKLPWDNQKAQRSAQEMFRRMWDFKWLPPGRGLWMMGAPALPRLGGAALNNCGYVSTSGISVDLADPFCWLMDMLMLGVGVGFDTRGAGLVKIQEPKISNDVHVVDDSREGWVELLRRHITAFSGKGSLPSEVDYSKVRPEGSPIRGFGGTASGHKPLMELVDEVSNILYGLVGKTIDATSIVDICNLVGRCVVAGNVRRSAEISFGEADDEDFLNLKNPKFAGDKLSKFRWASNNSVFAEVGMDYSKVSELTAINGEPGYEWLENAQAYSRMGSDPDYKDERAAGGNPCVTADTWVHTANGPAQVRDLVGKPFVAIVDGEAHNSGNRGFWYTGDKEVYKLTTDSGYEVRATADHKVLVRAGSGTKWVTMDNLTNEHKVVLSNNRDMTWWGDGSDSDRGEGYLLGLLMGDGTINGRRSVLSVWEKDGPGVVGVMAEVTKSIDSLGIQHRSDWNGWSLIQDRGEYRLNSTKVTDLAGAMGMVQGDKCPDLCLLEGSNYEFARGFIRGLFDADGSVQGSQEKGVSVRLSQTSLPLLMTIQRMLLRFGVVSKLYRNRQPARRAVLPDGKGSERQYDCSAIHELIISKDNLVQYQESIGFSHFDKRDALETALLSYKRVPNSEPFSSRVKSVKFDGVEPVYDAEVSTVHRFEANGIVVHNCLEQTLEDRELCCLVETFPSRHDTYSDFEKTLKYAYLYAKSVTLMTTHDERTNVVMGRNRRIGASQTGIVQAMVRHGRREFLNWCDSGYCYLQELDALYSDWLCIPRSKKITSVKPSGTVSLLPGVTPGIHFPHSKYYIRRIRFQDTSNLVQLLKDHGYPVEEDSYSPNTVVASFPIKEEYFSRGKSDVSMWEQLEMAAQMQQYWADNQVSVTVTFNPKEAKDIKFALELYETRLKGVSFLPLNDHGYEQAPYEEIDEAKFKSMSKKIKKIRPKKSNNIQHEAQDKFCDGDACLVDFNKK